MRNNQHDRSKAALAARLGRQFFAGAMAAGILAGCATQGYDRKAGNTVGAMQAGNAELALQTLEQQNPDKDKDLLYFMEKGELLRMKGSYEASKESWLAADEKVRGWEEQAKSDPSKLLGDVGSFLVNDTTRRYDGRDYEKTFINLRLALDHLAIGDWDSARTEIKKMHEREAVIAEFRSKELDAAKSSAESKGLKTTSFKELNGYPVETLTDPQVQALKNSYESAVANYLAGFVYEGLGEPSLAAAGYRKAIEMRPGEALLEDGLKGLDGRVRARSPKLVDTLIVIESGSAPAITSMTLPILLPIPSTSGLSIIATPISWPVIRAADSSAVPGSITIDGKTTPVALLTSVDQMARKALSDEMPGIIARSSVRAITRGVAQKAIDNNAGQLGAFGSLLSLAAKVGSVAIEVADERTWRTLPGFFSVARVKLPVGAHTIILPSPGGPLTREVKLSGNYALVTLRTSGPSLYLAQTPYDEQKAALAMAAPDTPPEPDKPVKTAKNVKKAAPGNAVKAAAAAKEKAVAAAAARKSAIVPVSASAADK
ncbi:COG3014 family protein [Herbaspirillum robiniae]|uniref:COG3014 family protein n=1 Tax=Herbaspirillum robiniae TaxID=2014887 RepID=UPI003D78A19D